MSATMPPLACWISSVGQTILVKPLILKSCRSVNVKSLARINLIRTGQVVAACDQPIVRESAGGIAPGAPDELDYGQTKMEER
jgi:hypothetical protein